MPIADIHPFDTMTVGSHIVNYYAPTEKRVVIAKGAAGQDSLYPRIIAIPVTNWQKHPIFDLWSECTTQRDCFAVANFHDHFFKQNLSLFDVVGMEAGLIEDKVHFELSEQLNLRGQFKMNGSNILYKVTSHILGKENGKFGVKIGLAYRDVEQGEAPQLSLRPVQEVMNNYQHCHR